MSRSDRAAALSRPAARRRVLMFAYYFPPYGGGGVQRTLKHVKYLPEHGFDPIVVTSRGRGFAIKDPTLARDVPPDAIVLRAREVPLQLVRWKLNGLLRRAGLPTRPALYVGWPDELVGWLPGALWLAHRAVRWYRPHVIYSTFSPPTAHLAGLILHRFTGLPWVADFRDSWTFNPQGQHSGWARASAAAERAVTAAASYAVAVDESIDLLGLPAGDPRLVIVRNGVDDEDLTAGMDQVGDSRTFRLSYVGSLYGARTAGPVFAAIDRLIERGVIDAQSFELRIVGDADVRQNAAMERVNVIRTGYVDHARALEEMAAASALLLYQPSSNRGSSGKIFEYLATGRPVLCVAGRDNIAARIVRELHAGVCVTPDDHGALAAAIEQLFNRWRVGQLGIQPSVRAETLRRFSRRKLAGDLARVLEAAIKGPPHEPVPLGG